MKIRQEETNLIGFFLLKTASGRTNRRSFPLASLQDVMHPPYKYTSASLKSKQNHIHFTPSFRIITIHNAI